LNEQERYQNCFVLQLVLHNYEKFLQPNWGLMRVVQVPVRVLNQDQFV